MKTGIANPVENFPQGNAGEKTRDLAAKAAGFGNGTPARVEGTF